MTVLDRFLKYVTFDTQSNEETGTTPSTQGQRVFAEAGRSDQRSVWRRSPWMRIVM